MSEPNGSKTAETDEFGMGELPSNFAMTDIAPAASNSHGEKMIFF